MYKALNIERFKILGLEYCLSVCTAHEIIDAVARELVSCFLRACKTFENVWPALSRTQAQNSHVCICLSQTSLPGSLGSIISDADSASLSAQHRILKRKLISSRILHYDDVCIMIMVTDMTETFLCLQALILFRLNGDQSLAIQMLQKALFEV